MSSDFQFHPIQASDLTLMRSVLSNAGYWANGAATDVSAARFVIAQFQDGVRTREGLISALSHRVSRPS
ncbi:hypothetical protein LXM94_01030 [Rhizobium sp. TRM95111]|uniref:hypothetical protein n=1 Tax=Rhizobium alarense TaxID=2846851 RepID=UPI001F3ADA5A|nr:hypothetical protein [Rhizobium alarense]MCF3638551.1 hypothetical protein [Rhizobium alarense]